MNPDIKYDPSTGLPIRDVEYNMDGTKRVNNTPYQPPVPPIDPKATAGTAEGGGAYPISQPSSMSTLDRLTGKKPVSATQTRVASQATTPASPANTSTPAVSAENKQQATPSVSSTPDDLSRFSFSEFVKNAKGEDDPKEERKRKAKLGLAALSDIIAAVGNLYATSQGAVSANSPSSVNALNKRFAELGKQRDADMWRRYAAYMQDERDRYNRYKDREAAKERADEVERRARWRDEDNERRARWRDEDKKQRAKERAEDLDYRKKRDKDNAARAWANINSRDKAAQDKADTKAKQTLRGKRLPFQKEDGGVINIYENAWKHNWEQVWDAIAHSSWAKRSENIRQLRKLKSTRDKQSFVQQNWNKIDDAIYAMEKLSQYDPAIDYDNDSSDSGSAAPWITNKNNDLDAPWAKH